MWELHIGMFRTMHGSKNEYRLTTANGQLYLKLFRHCQMWKTGFLVISASEMVQNGCIMC